MTEVAQLSGAVTRRRFVRVLSGAILFPMAASLAAACQQPAPAAGPGAAARATEAPKPAAPAAPAAQPAQVGGSPVAAKPAQAAAAAKPQRGGTFVFAIVGNPGPGFDPPATPDAVSNNVTRHVCDYLVERDEQGRLVPSLAKSWSFTNDRTLVLTLQEGVKFHDGSPWNAETAKANLDRLIENKVIRGDVVSPYVASAEVVDPLTLRLSLKVPFAGLMRHFAHRGLAMVSLKSLQAGEEERKQRPIGTGPFVFGEYRPNEAVLLTANADHWRGRPNLDRLIFKIVGDPSARVLGLKAGELQAVSTVAPAHALQLKQESNIEVISIPSERTVAIGFNNQKKPFDDKRVRQALSYAINRKPILDNLLQGFGAMGDSHLQPGTFGYKPTRMYEYNPDRAKQLLAEAGLAGGFKTSIIAPKGRYAADYEIAQAMQADFKAVGVELAIQILEGAAFISATNAGGPDKAQYDLTMLGNAAVTGDAQYYFTTFYDSQNWTRANTTFYANKEVDALVGQAAAAPDEAKQLELYARVQQILMDDLPSIPLYYEPIIAARRKEAQGVQVFSSLQYDMRQAWIEKA